MQTYILCGYGLPDNMATDANYQTYLHIAFNYMFTNSANQPATIIPCGGPTGCEPGMEGTEAEAMADELQTMMQREELVAPTQAWQIIPENTSLSSLENQLFARDIMQRNEIAGPITVFCDATRAGRIRIITEKIHAPNPVTVVPIDFDVSANRYANLEAIAEKEAFGIKENLWTLEDPERIKHHHQLFEEKFAFLRKRQSEGLSHVEAVAEWFTKSVERLKELMPDHPLIQEL